MKLEVMYCCVWRSFVGPTFFRSAARGLHAPAARRAASRGTRRGSAGPANGRESAAAKSWAAGVESASRFACYDVPTERTMTSYGKNSSSKRSTAQTGKFVRRDSRTSRLVDSKSTRVVLFPTEASKVGRKKIEHAVDRVSSKK